MSDDFREYGVEYTLDGSHWSLSIMAQSPEDAMRRVTHAANWGRCYTPHGIAMNVPAIAGAGIFVRAWCWLANRIN